MIRETTVLKQYGRSLAGSITGQTGRWILIPALAAVAVVAIVRAQQLQAVPPSIQLSADPLFAPGTAVKPTMTLALSVEYPTVGAAYVDKNSRDPTYDDTYNPANTYVGYFDAGGCYSYSNNRFERTGSTARTGSGDNTTDSHTCSNQFSGNFLNWAASSAIDILRLGLTGGDRIVDNDDTVLQRAYLPDEHSPLVPYFYNERNFPEKVLKSGYVSGAIPAAQRPENGAVHIANCGTVMYMGTRKGGSCGAPGTNGNLGTFQVAVKVCDSGDAAARPKLCHQYPNGRYKPIGNLQRYSDALRVAVFSYLNAPGTEQYGGVLRAKMKYVGPRAYDANYQLMSGVNPEREWDPDTGVFRVDPSPTGSSRSGVISYVNQFGRQAPNGGGVNGGYKVNDPISELYYEALRYLQGLSPTLQATANLDVDMQDGFPVLTTWADPLPANTSANQADYKCVSNSILTIGDVHTWHDRSIPAVQDTSRLGDDFDRSGEISGRTPDFADWTNRLGTMEAKHASTSTTAGNKSFDFSNLAAKSTNDNLGNSYYIAGMAYWANANDIRPDRPGMRVRTYAIDVNEYGDSSNPDNAVYYHSNQLYLAAKYGGFDAAQSKDNDPHYPVDAAVGTTPNNSLWARTGTEDPKNYFLASEAQDFLDALDTIFKDQAKAAYSIAGSAVSQRNVGTSGSRTRLYQAKFNPTDWTGDLTFNYVEIQQATTSGGAPKLNFPPGERTASETLAAQTSRNIVIGTNLSGNNVAQPFDTDHAGTLAAYLDDSATPDQTKVTALINYISGKNIAADQQAYGWRPHPVDSSNKPQVMGDVINSGVVFDKASDTVYVGANDGMLHAFAADLSKEKFAYIPKALAPKLRLLPLMNYQHRSYVDATPTVAQAQIGSDWKTILAGGLGAGGQGVYALDVTSPDNFSASDVLWEFTDEDDADLGNVIGRVQILKLRGKFGSDNIEYRWFAVFASGVNNYSTKDPFGATDSHTSANGNPVLFMLDLSKAKGDKWVLNNNFYKIPFTEVDNADLAHAYERARGIVGFSYVPGPRGEAKQIYAGDLHGNVWRVNLGPIVSGNTTDTNADPTAWYNHVSRLFIAKAQDSGQTLQPITAEPGIAYGPNGAMIVYIGTGKMLEPDDVRTMQAAVSDGVHSVGAVGWVPQSAYALLDDGRHDVASRGNLAQISIQKTSAGLSLAADAFTWGCVEDAANGGACSSVSKQGWFLDLQRPGDTLDGERQLSGFSVFNGQLLFSSVIAASTGCSPGSGYIYRINEINGSGDARISVVGIPGKPLVLTARDSFGKPTSVVVTSGTGSGIEGDQHKQDDRSLGGGRASGLVSWREVVNFQQVHK